MKRIGFVFVLLMFAAAAFSMTASQIGTYLKNYEEEGYKYVKEVTPNSWMVKFELKDWKYSWKIMVSITTNSSDPGYDVIFIYTTVKSYKESVPEKLMEAILEENENDANYGSYGIYYSEDAKEMDVDYCIKILRTELTKDSLIGAIGFVGGYANAKADAFEKFK
jgi:hypothetical protein